LSLIDKILKQKNFNGNLSGDIYKTLFEKQFRSNTASESLISS
jgi:hypothetical protein